MNKKLLTTIMLSLFVDLNLQSAELARRFLNLICRPDPLVMQIAELEKFNPSDPSLLILYTKIGNFEKVKEILQLKTAIQNPYGYNYIYAIDIETIDTQGNTALSIACDKGFLEIATALIRRDANINTLNKYKQTPLMRAASNGHETIIDLLLKDQSIYIDATDIFECTALIDAITEGHTNSAKILIKAGANIYHKNINGLSCLDIAQLDYNKEIIELLESKIKLQI